MRGPQLGDVVGAEGDAVDVIRCRQSVFLRHYPQPQTRRRARAVQRANGPTNEDILKSTAEIERRLLGLLASC
jgi:hypothetical protein